jgi:hypothetical protein
MRRPTLDRSKVYVFLLRDKRGDRIGFRRFERGAWKVHELRELLLCGVGPWRVLRSEKPFWRRGPRMVLEVAA